MVTLSVEVLSSEREADHSILQDGIVFSDVELTTGASPGVTSPGMAGVGSGGYPGQATPGGYPGQATPGGYPGQATPGGYPGQATPGGYPGQATPGGYPGQATPGGYPGQATPGGYPGQATPGGYPGQATPGGYPGQATPGGYPGQATPGGYPGQATPGGYPGQATPRHTGGNQAGAFGAQTSGSTMGITSGSFGSNTALGSQPQGGYRKTTPSITATIPGKAGAYPYSHATSHRASSSPGQSVSVAVYLSLLSLMLVPLDLV